MIRAEAHLRAKWIAEMSEMLRKAGYDDTRATSLYEEGMGPDELEVRLHEVGGITRTHGIGRRRKHRGSR